MAQAAHTAQPNSDSQTVGLVLEEVVMQSEVHQGSSKMEFDGRSAWSQTLDQKMEQVCSDLRLDLKGSMRLMMEAMSMKHDESLNMFKVNYEEMQHELKQLKAHIATHQASTEQPTPRPIQQMIKNGRLLNIRENSHSSVGPLGPRLEERVRRLTEMVKQLQASGEARGDAQEAMICELKEKTESDLVCMQARFEAVQSDMVKKITSKHDNDISELQKFLDEDGRLRKNQADACLQKAQTGLQREITDLRDLIGAVTRRVDTLASNLQDAVTHRAGNEKDTQEKYEKQCNIVRKEIDNFRTELLDHSTSFSSKNQEMYDRVHDRIEKQCVGLRREMDSVRSDLSEQCRSAKATARDLRHEQQAILEKLDSFKPTDIEALKAGLEDHKNSVRSRLIEMAAQLEPLAASVRDEPRLRSELGERLERQVSGLEQKLRGQLQESLDELGHKHQKQTGELQEDLRDSLHKFHTESLTRRLTEQNELLDDRVQVLIQMSQKRMHNQLEESKTGLERQTVYLKGQISQECAVREAGEERLHKKLDNAIKHLNNEQEALRQKLVPSTKASSSKGTFSWEDEARRLWEALDQHTH